MGPGVCYTGIALARWRSGAFPGILGELFGRRALRSRRRGLQSHATQSFLIHFGLSLAAALLCPLGEPSDGLRGLLRVVMGVPGHRELGTLIIYLPTVSKPPHGGHAKGR